ncbi:MAG: helix-turn-helix transcriptional regulator [Clostridium sp.]
MGKNIKLKQMRIGKQWTQQFVADEVGVCLRQYVNYENGQSIPNIVMAKKIADLFNKTIDDIFFKPMTN